MVLQLHCATPTITISPPPARPRHYPHHLYGASGALPAPARGLGHLPRLLLVGVRDPRADGAVCHVRRQVRYDEEDEEEEDGEEWGHNEDVARMERYSEDARDQALLVKARVDDEVEVVLVFRVPRQTLTLLRCDCGSSRDPWVRSVAGLLVELERGNGRGSGEERPAGEGDHTVGRRGEGAV